MFKWLQNISTKEYFQYRYATMLYNKANSENKLSILKKGLNESGKILSGKYTIYYIGSNRNKIKEDLNKILKTI